MKRMTISYSESYDRLLAAAEKMNEQKKRARWQRSWAIVNMSILWEQRVGSRIGWGKK
jgi:hypothetical protein